MTATPVAGEAAIFAVIVTYNPDVSRLATIVRALSCSVSGIAIVDNGSANMDNHPWLRDFPSLVIRRFPENRGIGAAQNEGITLARSSGARYVLFLDQDSVPGKAMVASLVSTLDELVRNGVPVACIGPKIEFAARGSASKQPGCSPASSSRIAREERAGAVECDAIISSGTLVPMTALADVGGMDESLFLDQVDTEWCLRARAKGYRIFRSATAILEHRLGETYRRLWIGRWRRLPRHKPFRYYYIFRNTVLLSRRSYVPFKRTLFDVQWLVALLLVYGVFTRERNGELRMMLRGLVDGFRGVTGKLTRV